MTPRQKFEHDRYMTLILAAESFGVNPNDGSLRMLETCLSSYRKSQYDYDEMVFRAEMDKKAKAAREASKLPKDLLETFYRLQKELTAHDKNPGQQQRWIDAFRLLMIEIDRDATLLAEEEAPQWLARGCVFLQGPELTHLFRRLWPYCLTEKSGRVGSILGAVCYSLPTNGVNVLKQELTLDENTAYSSGLVQAYNRLNRGW